MLNQVLKTFIHRTIHPLSIPANSVNFHFIISYQFWMDFYFIIFICVHFFRFVIRCPVSERVCVCVFVHVKCGVSVLLLLKIILKSCTSHRTDREWKLAVRKWNKSRIDGERARNLKNCAVLEQNVTQWGKKCTVKWDWQHNALLNQNKCKHFLVFLLALVLAIDVYLRIEMAKDGAGSSVQNRKNTSGENVIVAMKRSSLEMIEFICERPPLKNDVILVSLNATLVSVSTVCISHPLPLSFTLWLNASSAKYKYISAHL